jgi:uncharacterized phage protein (TIGR01671 family)
MENRYLFRGKRTDTGEWIIGSLLVDKQQDIETGEQIEIIGIYPSEYKDFAKKIDPSTICQCTGLKDKNGRVIWENDILYNGNYFVVKWNTPCARFDIVLNNSHNIPMGKWEPMICDWKTNDFKEYRKAVDYEVIGNIFDNLELLEV